MDKIQTSWPGIQRSLQPRSSGSVFPTSVKVA